MPRGAGWLALSVGLAACGRTPEPETTRPAESVVTVSSASASPAPAAPPKPDRPPSLARCVVPTPTNPPPTAAKAARCPPDPGGPGELPRGYVTFREASGAPRVAVELARTPESRERGLMYRIRMPEDEGMLFSWDTEEVRTFWMHDTCLPLDMLFIAKDGTIAGVLEQVPTLNDDSRTIPCPVAHVLELGAGYARAHGIQAGQRVEFEP